MRSLHLSSLPSALPPRPVKEPAMNPSLRPTAKTVRRLFVLLSFALILPVGTTSAQPTPAHGERIKDIAHIRGVRQNQLFGYGLVVGLNLFESAFA